jgi:Domain of unknown function (DUF4160)
MRVMIYTNDHRPAHAHVWDRGRQLVFYLNCPDGPLELRENYGFAWPELNRLVSLLQMHIRVLCAAWRAIHGNF